MFKIYLLSLLLFISATNGQDEKIDREQSSSFVPKIHESLKKLKKLSATDYFKNIDEYRGDLEKYFDHKKRVCGGEFSTIILSSAKDEVVNKKVKLSREERVLCFRELKALQVTFVNNMFVARKRYLTSLHERRLKELEKAREDSIKSLHSSFDKKRR